MDRLAETEGTKCREETDRLIYEKMYARAPKKTDATKIRFWRTGRHLPANREEALLFAKALRLNQQEINILLQVCMEKSDVVFDTPPGPEDARYQLYIRRTTLMESLISEYIAAVPPARIFQLNIPYDNLSMYARHLFCMDALNATALSEGVRQRELARRHLSSNNFESEFLRIRRLLGEIPRRTMLRMILLLGVPYLNRRLVDERLSRLGYLPLTEEHTSQRGALVDDLVIGFLKLYEKSCTEKDPLACRSWIFEQLSRLDRYLLDSGKEEYRPIYFRMLSTMAWYGEA